MFVDIKCTETNLLLIKNGLFLCISNMLQSKYYWLYFCNLKLNFLLPMLRHKTDFFRDLDAATPVE